MQAIRWPKYYGILELLINTLEYRYYKDKNTRQREDLNNINIINNDNYTNRNNNKPGIS